MQCFLGPKSLYPKQDLDPFSRFTEKLADVRCGLKPLRRSCKPVKVHVAAFISLIPFVRLRYVCLANILA